MSAPSLSRRSCGVLLHPTSLSGPRGGVLGAEAMRFVDFLSDCGVSWWQMLPICPPDENGSPYASPAVMTGSPALISVDDAAERGLLKPAELGQSKTQALHVACEHFSRRASREDRADFDVFCAREATWLEDAVLFQALKESLAFRPWTEWDEPLRCRESRALEDARTRLSDQMKFHRFCQWLFNRQWESLRRHAAARGVGLMGDAPIYVRHDSVDCWANQNLFMLDADGHPTVVAGVPPDYFSKTGQLWGNPIYRWDAHRAEGFAWWIKRLRVNAERFDALRLDHFIGFRNYWEIPHGETTAINGRWVVAPGDELFSAVSQALPSLAIVAEDLGVVTPEVTALRQKFGFPGMKVAQFCFDGGEDQWPASWPEDVVGYTGTHDNDTTRGWFEDATQAGTARVTALQRALKRAPVSAAADMMGLVWASPARTAIAPMQDLLDLGGRARMNTPGIATGNWRWRMDADALSVSLAGRLGRLTGSCGRAAGVV